MTEHINIIAVYRYNALVIYCKQQQCYVIHSPQSALLRIQNMKQKIDTANSIDLKQDKEHNWRPMANRITMISFAW